jgi:hypothetical protein
MRKRLQLGAQIVECIAFLDGWLSSRFLTGGGECGEEKQGG